MSKNIENTIKEFENELKLNDEKVKKEQNLKSREELSAEFVNFVKSNTCKIRGGKNGKK